MKNPNSKLSTNFNVIFTYHKNNHNHDIKGEKTKVKGGSRLMRKPFKKKKDKFVKFGLIYHNLVRQCQSAIFPRNKRNVTKTERKVWRISGILGVLDHAWIYFKPVLKFKYLRKILRLNFPSLSHFCHRTTTSTTKRYRWENKYDPPRWSFKF